MRVYDQQDDSLFRATFSQAAIGLSHVSLNGEWLLVNQRLCEIVGYSKEELLQITFQDITHPEDLRKDLDLVEKVLRGEIQTYSIEKRYIKKDHSFVWVNLTVSLARAHDGNPLFFISVVEDIHEKKSHEDHLNTLYHEMKVAFEERTLALRNANQSLQVKEHERKLSDKIRSSFFEISRELMVIFDRNGVVVEANPAMIQHLGYSADELKSRPFIDFVHPDDRMDALRVSEEFSATEKLSNFECRYLCKSGTVRILSWSATSTPDDERIYATARDMTEIRQHEREITEQKTKIAASSKINALGKMAAGIAHEINNPLTIVYGQINYLKKVLISTPPDLRNVERICDSISEMCQRIVRIIHGLRTFSRDGSSDPMEFTPLREILSQTLPFCAGKMRSSGIDLVVQDIPETYGIFCRPTEISQVLLNLLNNASDAVSTSLEKKIEIDLVDENGQLGLAIIDSGNGMTDEQAQNLFQPFFTTKEVGKGTGLGLSISKGIMDSHSGHIYFRREDNETKFVFTLPKSEAFEDSAHSKVYPTPNPPSVSVGDSI